MCWRMFIPIALLVGAALACSSLADTRSGAPDEGGASQVISDSGLRYTDLIVGDGEAAQAGAAVSVHYTGWLLDGTKFDSSLDRGTPFEFVLGQGQVIKGWDEGVASMKVGGKRKLIIPASLAYGDRAVGDKIPSGATLVFEVELLAIR